MRAALLLLLVVGCSRRGHVESCDDDLGGEWRDADGKDWMILDERGALEVFPVFTDTAAPEGVVAAPRVMDLVRANLAIAGTVKRRYERRGEACEAHAAVRVTACKDDELTLVLAEPVSPTAFAPCTWPPPVPAGIARWHRR